MEKVQRLYGGGRVIAPKIESKPTREGIYSKWYEFPCLALIIRAMNSDDIRRKCLMERGTTGNGA